MSRDLEVVHILYAAVAVIDLVVQKIAGLLVGVDVAGNVARPSAGFDRVEIEDIEICAAEIELVVGYRKFRLCRGVATVESAEVCFCSPESFEPQPTVKRSARIRETANILFFICRILFQY